MPHGVALVCVGEPWEGSKLNPLGLALGRLQAHHTVIPPFEQPPSPVATKAVGGDNLAVHIWLGEADNRFSCFGCAEPIVDACLW